MEFHKEIARMRDRLPCVYLLASVMRRTLYIGVTSDLIQRVWQHQNDLADGFTRKHRIHTLVCFERHETMESAIRREKAMKEWRRSWKLKLIETHNPHWLELYPDIL